MDPTCCECGKQPHEIQEYIDGAAEWNEIDHSVGTTHTPLEYMLLEEGTYNSKANHFCCTPCYIKIGMPSRNMNHPLGGWVAP